MKKLIPLFIIKNHVNTNFTSLPSSNRESFGLLNNEVKQNEPGLILNKLRSKNNDRLIIGYLNINFI